MNAMQQHNVFSIEGMCEFFFRLIGFIYVMQ